MKKISIVLISVLIISSGCKTKRMLTESQIMAEQAGTAGTTDFTKQITWLLGYFTKDRMTTPPHSGWYQKGYDEYKWDEGAVNKLTELSKTGLSIKIVMGSWCPDSRREVPRFMRILDLWGFPPEKVTFIGVDDAKLSPVGEYDKLDIQRVPTFILYKNNIETGRIIETPVTSLEQDMVNILAKE
jgi:thiol-disulfide isomerase/thioredoxin